MKNILLLLLLMWQSVNGAFVLHDSFLQVVVESAADQCKRDIRAIKYGIVRELFDQYTRPFTVCNFGSELAVTMARDYPQMTSVVVGAKNNKQLLDYFKHHQDVENVVVLKDKITLADWLRLSECEHFDVSLAFDNLSRFKDEWRTALDHFLCFGDYIVVEVSCGKNCSEYNNAIKEELEHRGALLCAHIDCPQLEKEHFIVLLATSNPYVKRSNWRNKKMCEPGKYVITSTFDKKTLHKTTTGSITNWEKGINLRTYTGLDGAHPDHETILSQIAQMSGLQHNDFLPCNLVLQGKRVIPIDFGDPRRKLSFEKGFERCMNMFNPNYVKPKS